MATRESPGKANELQNLLFMPAQKNNNTSSARVVEGKAEAQSSQSQESSLAAPGSANQPLAVHKGPSSSYVQLPQLSSGNGIHPPLIDTSKDGQQRKNSQTPMLSKTGDTSVLASPANIQDPSPIKLVLPASGPSFVPQTPILSAAEKSITTNAIQSQSAPHQKEATRTKAGVAPPPQPQIKHAQSAKAETPNTDSQKLSLPARKGLTDSQMDSSLSKTQSVLKVRESKSQGFFSCFSCCGSKSNSSNRRNPGPLQPAHKPTKKGPRTNSSKSQGINTAKDEVKNESVPSNQSQLPGDGSKTNSLEGPHSDGIIVSPQKIPDLSRSNDQKVNNNSLDAGPSNQKQRDSKHVKNSNAELISLEEIKIELPALNSKRGSQKLPPLGKHDLSGAGDEASAMDSYNDDDEIEDENRNPAAMQINHSSSVTRAGAQRNNFGPVRISPSKNKANWGTHQNSQLPQILEIGTEETVLRGMDQKLMTQSPSIRDVSCGNQVTPAGSIVSLPKDPNAPDRQDTKGVDVGFFSLRPIQPEVTNQITPRSGSHEEKMSNNAGHSSHYASAKVGSNVQSLIEKDANDKAHSSNHANAFDHQQAVQDLHGNRIDDHTFGNVNSKRSLMEHEEMFKVTEAGIGNAIGQENPIIRPSGSKSSLKQHEDIAPSSSANEDLGSAANQIPNKSTAMQSSFTGPNKQDSQQYEQERSVSIDVSVGVSIISQPNVNKVGGPKGNYLNTSKIQPVSTKSRPTPNMATLSELNNTGVKMRSSEAAFNRGMINQLGAGGLGALGQQEQNKQREHALKRELTKVHDQYRSSKKRQQNAARRLDKIQKELKNVDQDNQELQLLLTQLLQRKLQGQQ